MSLSNIHIKSKGHKVNVKTRSLPRSKVGRILVTSRKVVPEQRKVHFLKYAG